MAALNGLRGLAGMARYQLTLNTAGWNRESPHRGKAGVREHPRYRAGGQQADCRIT
jgi:hypothetical protein